MTYANRNPDLGLRKAQNAAGSNQLMVHNPADFDIWILKTAIKFFLIAQIRFHSKLGNE